MKACYTQGTLYQLRTSIQTSYVNGMIEHKAEEGEKNNDKPGQELQ